MPLGEIRSLAVGTLIQDDVPVHSPDLVEMTVRLDFSIGDEGLVTRRELVNQGVFHALGDSLAGELANPEDCWWYRARSVDRAINLALFPASTLFTAFYAPASRLAYRIFGGDFSEMSESLVHVGRTKPIDSSGHAVIAMQRGVLTVEALTVSRAYYSESFRRSIQEIREHAIKRVRAGEESQICCSPPSKRLTTLRVRGILDTRNGTGQPNFIVLAILSSDEEMPFKSVDMHVDQTEKSLPDEGEGAVLDPTGTPRKPPESFSGLFVHIDGNGTIPGSPTPMVVCIDVPNVDFTKVSRYSKIVRKKGKKKAEGKRPLWDSSTRRTTRRKEAGGDGNNKQTDLTPPGPYSADGEDDSDEQRSPIQALRSVLSAVELLPTELGISVTSRCVTPEMLRFENFQFNLVSVDVADRSQNWTHILGGEYVRPVLILELQQGPSFSYILEIVRNPSDQFSTLIFCMSDKACISDQCLQRAFSLVDSSQQLPNEIAFRAAVSHMTDSEPAISAAERAIAKRVRHSYGDSASLATRLSSLLR
jgi:hypothetical protein